MLTKFGCQLSPCHVTGFLSHHHHPSSLPPLIVNHRHRHRRQQRQPPTVHNPDELPHPLPPLLLPECQIRQDTAATSQRLTSTNKPDDECPAPNACLPPHHPLTATSPGSTSTHPHPPAYRHITGVDECQQAKMMTMMTSQLPTPAHCPRQRQQAPPNANLKPATHPFDNETPCKQH